jgi:DNA-binding response OmpR family regulator
VVLLADDDVAMRSLILDELQEEGYSVFQVADGHDALDYVDDCSPDLILTDLRMPHGGLDLVARFRARAPETPIILMTAFGDATTEATAYEKGASAYFNKPVRMGDLKSAIHRLLGDGTSRR